jgi:hypothetical protein
MQAAGACATGRPSVVGAVVGAYSWVGDFGVWRVQGWRVLRETGRMADKTIIAIREAAEAYAAAVRATERFFDKLEDADDPGVLVEYATLAEREKEAAAARLDAIVAAGIEVPSIDESDPDN